MSEAWKRLDLEGGGLQAANVRLAGLLKRRAAAYGLLLVFPLGLHRAYLEDRRGAWAYRLAALAAVGAWAAALPYLAAALLLAVIGFALYDLRWIDGRVARLNKALRMKVYLGQGAGAPPGFRGRYSDGALDERKAGERPGSTPDAAGEARLPARAPSFAEQEARLRELAKLKKRGSQSQAED